MAGPSNSQTTPPPARPSANVLYTGYVRAITACFFGTLRAEGDEWQVEGIKLWSDDPFVAITGPSTDFQQSPTFAPGDPGAPIVNDFTTRGFASQVTNPAPTPAAQSGI